MAKTQKKKKSTKKKKPVKKKKTSVKKAKSPKKKAVLKKKSVKQKKAAKKKTVKKKALKKKAVKKKKKAVKKAVKKKAVKKKKTAKKKSPLKKSSQAKKSDPKTSEKKVARKKKVKKVEVKADKTIQSLDTEGSSALGLTPMKIYLNQIEHIPLLTPEEEKDLAKKIFHKPKNWEQARDKMIQSNLRLVINIAKRYANIGLSFSDLVEEGNIGLMRAVDKFDYRKGYRFSTYASWWIKQGMMRALSNQSKMIRIPVHMYESITKWRKSRELYIQRYGRIPTRKEIAAVMKVPEDKVKEIESVLNNPGSLNTPLSIDSSNELIEVIEDKDSTQPYESSHNFFRSERIEELLQVVSDRERRIIMLRFGLCGEEPHTLAQTAEQFGITRERVRQIEEAAIRKIGNEAKKQNDNLRNYL